jgi:hypothetical protein
MLKGGTTERTVRSNRGRGLAGGPHSQPACQAGWVAKRGGPGAMGARRGGRGAEAAGGSGTGR